LLYRYIHDRRIQEVLEDRMGIATFELYQHPRINRQFAKNRNWVALLLLQMNLLVLWISCGIPGASLIDGYIFLLAWLAAVASLIGVPILLAVDLLLITLNKKNIAVWPYHGLAILFGCFSLTAFIIRLQW
jgi:hypothetical protein